MVAGAAPMTLLDSIFTSMNKMRSKQSAWEASRPIVAARPVPCASDSRMPQYDPPNHPLMCPPPNSSYNAGSLQSYPSQPPSVVSCFDGSSSTNAFSRTNNVPPQLIYGARLDTPPQPSSLPGDGVQRGWDRVALHAIEDDEASLRSQSPQMHREGGLSLDPHHANPNPLTRPSSVLSRMDTPPLDTPVTNPAEHSFPVITARERVAAKMWERGDARRTPRAARPASGASVLRNERLRLAQRTDDAERTAEEKRQQSLTPVAREHARLAALGVPGANGRCPNQQCNGVDIIERHGEVTCNTCGASMNVAKISLNCNSNKPKDEEDATVRGDAPQVAHGEPPPAMCVADLTNASRTRLGMSGTLCVPKGCGFAQVICDRTAARDAALSGCDGPAESALRNKGHSVQRALEHLFSADPTSGAGEEHHRCAGSYIGLLLPALEIRVRRYAETLWQCIEAHHAACTRADSTCELNLRDIPARFLALMAFSMCLAEAVEETEPGTLEEQQIGDVRALARLENRVREDMRDSTQIVATQKPLCLAIAAKLLRPDLDTAAPCHPCAQTISGNPFCVPNERPRGLTIRTTLASVSSGAAGELPVSQRYRAARLDDDASSVSSPSASIASDLSHGSPRAIGPGHLRRAFGALMLNSRTSLRITTAAKTKTTRTIVSPSFVQAFKEDEVLRCASPIAVTAAVAYYIQVDSTESASTTSTDVDMSGSGFSNTGTLGPIHGSPPRFRQGLGLFAQAAAVGREEFRRIVRAVRPFVPID